MFRWLKNLFTKDEDSFIDEEVYSKQEYETMTAAFPHCDSNVLHYPGSCTFCDEYPEKQAYRLEKGIGFTNEAENPNVRIISFDCPSFEFRTRENIEKWYGNVPYPKGLENER